MENGWGRTGKVGWRRQWRVGGANNGEWVAQRRGVDGAEKGEWV